MFHLNSGREEESPAMRLTKGLSQVARRLEVGALCTAQTG